MRELEKELVFWRSKRNNYAGEKELMEVLKELKVIPRKRLEKELNQVEYLEDNSFNFSYIFVFNILGDNSYFPDKTTPLLDQEYHLGKQYSMPEDQKKQFQKLVNYGRLNILIDNE